MTYKFRMTFKLPIVEDLDEYDERLFSSSLTDDAFFGISENGILEVEFDREGAIADKVVTDALSNIQTVLGEAIFIEAFPDIVNLTNLAECIGVSRQAARKLWESNLDSFPIPLHSGKSMEWNLASILDWMRSRDHDKFESQMYEVAFANMQLNIERRKSDVERLSPSVYRTILTSFEWEPIAAIINASNVSIANTIDNLPIQPLPSTKAWLTSIRQTREALSLQLSDLQKDADDPFLSRASEAALFDPRDDEPVWIKERYYSRMPSQVSLDTEHRRWE